LFAEGLAAFRTPESCADALAAYFGRRPTALVAEARLPWIWPAGVPTAGNLNEYDALQVFSALGIPTAKTVRLTCGQNEGPGIPFPLVAKVLSRDIPHKTESGGVRVGIDNHKALRGAIMQVQQNARAAHSPIAVFRVL